MREIALVVVLMGCTGLGSDGPGQDPYAEATCTVTGGTAPCPWACSEEADREVYGGPCTAITGHRCSSSFYTLDMQYRGCCTQEAIVEDDTVKGYVISYHECR